MAEQPINNTDDIEFDIWHEIQRRIDVFRRKSMDRPTRLYLGKEHERDLRNHPNVLMAWRYLVPPQVTAVNEIFGLKVYTVDNDYRHLEIA